MDASKTARPITPVERFISLLSAGLIRTGRLEMRELEDLDLGSWLGANNGDR